MFGKKEEVPDIEYFALFDSKVGVYRDPVVAMNRYDMLRHLEHHFRDSSQAKSQLVMNPEDFALFKVGDFCRKTGILRGCNPEHVANLHDIKSAVVRSYPHDVDPGGH